MKNSYTWVLLLVILVGAPLSESALAGARGGSLTVAPYFSSHMVLQQKISVPVWGTAAPGATITVTFTDQSVAPPVMQSISTPPVGPTGQWKVSLLAMDAIVPATNTPGGTLVISSNDGASISFTDVKVGEVWVLSGQSNINVMLKDCDGGTAAISDSIHYPNIRLYLVPQTGPLTETWKLRACP